MADICVVFAQEDKATTGKLVNLLRKQGTVWWSEDIPQGNWRPEVKKQIDESSVVVAVLSKHSDSKDILHDELDYAKKIKRSIFLFLLEDITPPFGFASLNHTKAYGWRGNKDDAGFRELNKKLSTKIQPKASSGKSSDRLTSLQIGSKEFKLPGFIFSLSSHETQLRPKDGIELLQFLEPQASLISAYDAQKSVGNGMSRKMIEQLLRSQTVLFLDSGNYEASRKSDYKTKRNKKGWSQQLFREVATDLAPDCAFSYDKPNPKGSEKEIAGKIVRSFNGDRRAVNSGTELIPIVHLRKDDSISVRSSASRIVKLVSQELDPIAVAIPERELGDGLIERLTAVRDIRRALDSLGKYYPLHLLGTGNPITMTALAAAGADSFDGLEWCRTVTDYDKGYLFHFHHFDCFKSFRSANLKKTREILENSKTPYSLKVASFNFDYFMDLMFEIQNMIHAGQAETLLKNHVPHIHTSLIQILKEKK